MSLEDDLFDAAPAPHRAKLRRSDSAPTGSGSISPTPSRRFWPTYSAKTAEELADKPRVRIAGRIQTIRRMGKAGFMHLLQSGERLQVYVRKDAVPEHEYALYEVLDLGDIVGVEGYLFRTRTGELSVHAEKLTFLSKILLTMPEKWHGLEDVEIRYRQRYLDLIANPESQKIFVTRAQNHRVLRRQLEARGFIEVETPMMQPLYGGATARPFVTHHNTLDMDLYLRIAPELYLKRLIVGGLERVYEINRNFRNEGISTQHNPEFTMLEFYQAYTDYQGLMDLHRRTAEADRDRCDRIGRWSSIRARSSISATSAGCRCRKRWATRLCKGHALVEAFERNVEPTLIQPTIIYEYPVEVSPLSKNKRERSGLRRALRDLRRRHGDRQRLHRVERSAGAAPPLRDAARACARPATKKRTRWTRIICARCPTACRRPAAKASASTA